MCLGPLLTSVKFRMRWLSRLTEGEGALEEPPLGGGRTRKLPQAEQRGPAEQPGGVSSVSRGSVCGGESRGPDPGLACGRCTVKRR